MDLRGWRRDGTLLPGLAIGAVFGLEFLFLYTGIGRTTASRAVVFLYTAPFFVALGVHFLLPDDRLKPAKALARVWQCERFSWQLTKLMHRFPEDGPFERAMQVAELDYIANSRAAQLVIAENYVGLPV